MSDDTLSFMEIVQILKAFVIIYRFQLNNIGQTVFQLSENFNNFALNIKPFDLPLPPTKKITYRLVLKNSVFLNNIFFKSFFGCLNGNVWCFSPFSQCYFPNLPSIEKVSLILYWATNPLNYTWELRNHQSKGFHWFDVKEITLLFSTFMEFTLFSFLVLICSHKDFFIGIDRF